MGEKLLSQMVVGFFAGSSGTGAPVDGADPTEQQ